MSAIVRPKLTPQERNERWWSRHPLPFYVRTKEKYGDSVYLIQTREDLLNLALAIVKQRYAVGYYGSKSWYFSGTYEEYVNKQIGLTVAEANAMLMGKELVASELKTLKDNYCSLQRRYEDERQALEDINQVHKIVKQTEDPYQALKLLLDRTGHQYEGFEIEQFDQIPTD